MKILKTAFTLTELLIAIGIIGAIAAMAVPNIVNSINKKIMTTHLKNNVETIKTLAESQLILYHTKDLSHTDFSDTETLLKHFQTTKTCGGIKRGTGGMVKGSKPLSIEKCWPKISYRSINDNTYSLKVENDTGLTYAAVLKNDAIIAITKDDNEDEFFTKVDIDLNGSSLPNTIGRDMFSLYVTKDGRIIGDVLESELSLNVERAKCQQGNPAACFAAIIGNGWNINY